MGAGVTLANPVTWLVENNDIRIPFNHEQVGETILCRGPLARGGRIRLNWDALCRTLLRF